MLNGDKTHCKYGHEFTEKNTRVRVTPAKTYRTCRACEQLRNKRSAAGHHAYERRRIVTWLRENGFHHAADRVEQCDHIIKRKHLGPFSPHRQQQESTNANT